MKVVDLVIIASLVVGGVVLTCWRLVVGDRFTPARLFSGIAATVYCAGLVFFTFLPLSIGPSEYEKPWWIWIGVVPFQDLVDDPIGLMLNVALFVPLGILAPLLLRTSTWLRTALVGLIVSGTIEIVQFIGDITISPGRVADIDDLITNVLGTVVGYLLLRLAMLVTALRRVADLVSWPSPGATDRHDEESLSIPGSGSGSSLST
ncbi:VanZ family protein [Microbacterium hydrocarbonoxydans]|uniref:VanZ family protein n=1 Tax=Microbacterium hydrocarbonoxydans TaxID=273678 RepID=UPI00203EC892|nr:VanZ family protein [Microbacterium hydrocarbonoxydans]MCM3781268.1 VanZ family protein [Microbacterium hydrocarbonoxydans]